MHLQPTAWMSAAMAALAAALWAAPAAAMPYEEALEDEDDTHIVRIVRDVYVNPADRALTARYAKADLDFVEKMGRHHQGAVDMAEAYLADPRGSNPVLQSLARGIIANQEFEIGVLKSVEHHVAAGPRKILTAAGFEAMALDRGVDGLEHAWSFRKSPPPSLVDIWLTPAFEVSDFDVQFIRPMVQHHQAALTMASEYNLDPTANNVLLRRLNNDILVDQRYEIGFIESVLARYPGDPQAVPDDPGMMAIMHRSMGDMMHGPGSEMPAH